MGNMRHPKRRSKWKPGRWNQWRSFRHCKISLCVQFEYIVLFKVFTILFHLFPWFPFYLLGNCDACWIFNFILQWFFLFFFLSFSANYFSSPLLLVFGDFHCAVTIEFPLFVCNVSFFVYFFNLSARDNYAYL